MKKGCVKVFTGNGKGKTTAAIGLSVRFAGEGLKVFLGQFIKKGAYSEIMALKRFSDLITVEQFGLGRFAGKDPKPDDIEAARKGLERVRQIIAGETYQLVILDEANVAVKQKLFDLQELVDLISGKPDGLQMVITGRYASAAIVELADEVIEFNPVKHYFEQGAKARVGIDK